MILTKGKDMIVTPTYYVFEMFKVHQGAYCLPTYHVLLINMIKKTCRQ